MLTILSLAKEIEDLSVQIKRIKERKKQLVNDWKGHRNEYLEEIRKKYGITIVSLNHFIAILAKNKREDIEWLIGTEIGGAYQLVRLYSVWRTVNGIADLKELVEFNDINKAIKYFRSVSLTRKQDLPIHDLEEETRIKLVRILSRLNRALNKKMK